jgi:hypothetical protein
MNNLKDIFKKELQLKGDKALLDARYMGIGHDDIFTAYDELGMDLPIKLTQSFDRYGFTERGWGNGYVRISEGHKYYGMNYTDIPVNVHGGLTFSENIMDNDKWSDGYWVGFDTAHYGDNQETCTMDYVTDETIDLFNEIYGLS